MYKLNFYNERRIFYYCQVKENGSNKQLVKNYKTNHCCHQVKIKAKTC